MMEQNNGDIFTNGKRSTSPLEKLNVWKDSSATFFIHAPDNLRGVSFAFGPNNVTATAKYEPNRRIWRAYLSPDKLATAGSYDYAVNATDEYGNTCILGKGTLVVLA